MTRMFPVSLVGQHRRERDKSLNSLIKLPTRRPFARLYLLVQALGLVYVQDRRLVHVHVPYRAIKIIRVEWRDGS